MVKFIRCGKFPCDWSSELSQTPFYRYMHQIRNERGTFLPLIFACVCLGMGLSMMVFPNPSAHVAFGAGTVTAVTLGAQLKKPLAVSLLLLLCFPVRLLFWIFLCAVIGKSISVRLFSH